MSTTTKHCIASMLYEERVLLQNRLMIGNQSTSVYNTPLHVIKFSNRI